MLFHQTSHIAYTLTGDILLTIIGFFVLFLLGVPVWISLGVTAYLFTFSLKSYQLYLLGRVCSRAWMHFINRGTFVYTYG